MEITNMRHRTIWMVVGWVVLTMAACGPKTTPLTSTLETFAAKDAAGEWTLQGVRVTGTDSVVVVPDSYQQITFDGIFVICVKTVEGVKQIWVYRPDGELVGWFDTFNHIEAHWKKQGMDYYLGTNYNQWFYYFPKTGVSIRTQQAAREEPDTLYLFVGDAWKAFTCEGDSLSSLPK